MKWGGFFINSLAATDFLTCDVYADFRSLSDTIVFSSIPSPYFFPSMYITLYLAPFGHV